MLMLGLGLLELDWSVWWVLEQAKLGSKGEDEPLCKARARNTTADRPDSPLLPFESSVCSLRLAPSASPSARE